MIWVYTIIVAFDLEEVYVFFEKQFDLFIKIINKYNNQIEGLLDYYNKAVLYMLMLDKNLCKPAVKALYKTFKEKRNTGEFNLQI